MAGPAGGFTLSETKLVMPVQKTRSGGYRYGPAGAGGKTYYGKGAKTKAAKQGRAISISKARKAGHRIPRRRRNGKR